MKGCHFTDLSHAQSYCAHFAQGFDRFINGRMLLETMSVLIQSTGQLMTVGL